MKHFDSTKTLAGLLLSLLVACDSPSGNNKTQLPTKEVEVVDSPPSEMPEIFGRLYTSGLSREEAEKLALAWPVYQLAGHENYFLSGHDSLNTYIGSCIGLEGTEVIWTPGTELVNGQFTYYRGKLDYHKIQLMNRNKCAELGSSVEATVPESGELQLYNGTVGRMSRPAPDIAYDYVLKLEKPFRDEDHPIEPGKLVEELPLFIVRQKEIPNLEMAISSGESVSVKGSLVPGYAESKALQVVEVE